MTLGRVEVGPAARRDLDEHSDWLYRESGSDMAVRFADAAAATFAKLAITPGVGAPTRSTHPELVGTRKWQIAGFPKMLIFYLPIADGVRILRVGHAAQGWVGS